MTPGIKTNSLQTYKTVLYNRVLHPELFPIKERRVLEGRGYEFEAWLMPGGHMLRCHSAKGSACELVTDGDDSLPDVGVVSAFLCAGEREHEHMFLREKLRYMTSVQTEQLSENLYHATYDELEGHANEAKAVVFRWNDATGPCQSILDMQRFSTEVHVQSYHMLATGGLVLRTQSIFEATK